MAPLIYAIGAGLKMYGEYRAGQDRAAALEDSARLQLINAGQARAAGAFNAERQQIQAEHMEGAMQAGYGASGVKGSGSVTEVMGMSRAFAEYDRLNIIHGAELRAINFENEANFNRSSAASDREFGIMKALGTGLSAVGNLYGSQNTDKKTGSDYQLDNGGYDMDSQNDPFGLSSDNNGASKQYRDAWNLNIGPFDSQSSEFRRGNLAYDSTGKTWG